MNHLLPPLSTSSFKMVETPTQKNWISLEKHAFGEKNGIAFLNPSSPHHRPFYQYSTHIDFAPWASHNTGLILLL